MEYVSSFPLGELLTTVTPGFSFCPPLVCLSSFLLSLRIPRNFFLLNNSGINKKQLGLSQRIQNVIPNYYRVLWGNRYAGRPNKARIRNILLTEVGSQQEGLLSLNPFCLLSTRVRRKARMPQASCYC